MVVSMAGVTGVPGQVVRGKYPLIELMPGGMEELEVVIATGQLPGPKLLLTGNIHGNEINPCIICHRIIEWLESAVVDGSLKGTVVLMPSLNPTGHRAGTRSPSFESVDPNRYWPDGFADEKKLSEELAKDTYANIYARRNEPGTVEKCWSKLFEIWRGVGFDSHCDLHTAGTLSHPFIFVDRVLHRGKETKLEAEQLWQKLESMCRALGITLIAEQPPKQYIAAALHRSTSGAVLNGLRVPSVTIECGGHGVATPTARDAVVEGIHNLMRHMGMQEGEIVPQTVVPAHLRLDNLHRYCPVTGIVDFVLTAGDPFEVGDLMAVVRNMAGEKLAEVRAEYSGFVVGWSGGIAFHEGDSIGSCGLPDGLPMVVDYDAALAGKL